MKQLLLFLLSAACLFAQEIILDEKDRRNITSETSYFLDKTSTLSTQEEVLNKDFIDTNTSKLQLGYQFDATLWIKFSLVNSSNKKIVKTLEYDYPTLREFTLFDLNISKEYKGGFLHAGEYKNTLNQPVKLTFQPHSKRDFLLKAQSTDTGLIAELIIWNVDSYNSHEQYQQHILFLFFGAMGALLLYNLSLLLFTKDSAYFYYSIVILTFMALELFLSGYINFVSPVYEVKRWHLYLLLDTMVFSVVFFSISYLQLKKNIPVLYPILLLFLGLVVILTFASAYDIVPTKIHRIILICSFSILIGIGFYALYKKVHQAKYYIFGWLFLLLFLIIETANQIGFANLFGDSPNITKLSLFGEALMFSIALSARIRLLENDKQEVIQKLYEQKEQESEKLEENVRQRTEELEEALNDKHLLLQEVHHRVKNNLQIVISLLRLQSDETNDKVLQEILSESESRVRAISNVHELLYQNRTLQHIDTQVYFEQMCHDIQASCGQNSDIKLIIDTKPSLPMDMAIYCGLIANELITNAFKYAFDGDGGEIKVILKEENGYTYIISDNGKGLGADVEENLGMVLVKTLVRKQLKGSTQIDRTNGTKYTIKFEGEE